MSPRQTDLYQWALAHGNFFTADEAALALGCTRDGASGRVRKLHENAYMIVRKSKASAGGQTAYFYRAVVKIAPVERGTFSECDALVSYAQKGMLINVYVSKREN